MKKKSIEHAVCGLCGGLMSLNPHPDAGNPAKVVTVGATYECIPCNKKALHGWAKRAGKAEAESQLLHKALEMLADIIHFAGIEDPDCPVTNVSRKECLNKRCRDCCLSWAMGQAKNGT